MNFLFEENGILVNGDFRDNKVNGFAKLFIENLFVFELRIAEERCHQYVYKGEWKDGKKDGIGTMNLFRLNISNHGRFIENVFAELPSSFRIIRPEKKISDLPLYPIVESYIVDQCLMFFMCF